MTVTLAAAHDGVDATTHEYVDSIGRQLDDGWKFAGLHISADHRLVRVLLAAADGSTRTVSVPIVAGNAPSIVELVPAAAWDEREAHDLFGVVFTGHEPLRPLVHHGQLADWAVPVHGDDTHQVAVGPIHAGVIESGHFRFHTVGDSILHVDAQLFYKHRGLELACVDCSPADGLTLISRACAACHVANSVAYAHACEQAIGLASTPELSRARTVLLELERLWNHLNDIAAICAGVGFATANNAFAALTERARRLNECVTGHRFLFGSVHIGENRLVLDRAAARELRTALTGLRGQVARNWLAVSHNRVLRHRLRGVGPISAERVARHGTVGPGARAAGVADDVRSTSPRLQYAGFVPVVAAPAVGDAGARLAQRALELWQTFGLLDLLLTTPLVAAIADPGGKPGPMGVGRVESPRGATSCVVELIDGRVGRVRLRTGSFANWPSVAAAATDGLVPDFPLINKSFELCYACADR